MKHGSVKVVTCVKYSLPLLPELGFGAPVFQAKPRRSLLYIPAKACCALLLCFSSNISVPCPGASTPHQELAALPCSDSCRMGGCLSKHRHTHIPGLPKEARNSAQMMSSINTACFHPHGAQTLQTLNAKLPVSNTRMKMFKGHKAFCF